MTDIQGKQGRSAGRMDKLGDGLLVVLLFGLMVGLAVRAARDWRTLHRAGEAATPGLHMGFVAVAPGDKEVQALPNKQCAVSLFFVIEPERIDDQVAWWNQALSRLDARAAGCSYAVCTSGACQPRWAVPAFHLLETVAYRPAVVFAGLADGRRFLVEDGKWTQQWSFAAPPSAETVRQQVETTGLLKTATTASGLPPSETTIPGSRKVAP